MLNAALDGELNKAEYRKDEVFGFDVPKHCPGVPDNVFDPASAWSDRAQYDNAYLQLAGRFIENFRKFAGKVTPEVRASGPVK